MRFPKGIDPAAPWIGQSRLPGSTRHFFPASGEPLPSGFSWLQTWRREPVVPSAPPPLPRAQACSPTIGAAELPPQPATTPRQRLEAVLFLSREPVSPRKLAQLADLADATQARTLARQLNETYDAGGHAFRVEEVAGGYILLTRPQFASWLRKLERVKPEEHQSPSALETLAIVAYRQPVLRADIEAIRGSGSDEVLKQLMQRDLVRICGRSEELGRPYLYGTTKNFLKLFGLKSLDRLPRSEWVHQADVQFEPPEADKTQPSDTYPN